MPRIEPNASHTCWKLASEWGLSELLKRAQRLGATQPEHYLLPRSLSKIPLSLRPGKEKWDVRILEIAPEDLRRCNINHVVELFSIDWADGKKLVDLLFLWGKCVLTFPVDDDPRPVTRIPEVRQFIQRLNSALPYFPCYLDFHPDFGMFIMYFSCLAQESALLKEGMSLNINDASVISSLLESMRSVGEIAARMQLDPTPTWHAMLSPYPPEFFPEMLEKLQ